MNRWTFGWEFITNAFSTWISYFVGIKINVLYHCTYISISHYRCNNSLAATLVVEYFGISAKTLQLERNLILRHVCGKHYSFWQLFSRWSHNKILSLIFEIWFLFIAIFALNINRVNSYYRKNYTEMSMLFDP